MPRKYTPKNEYLKDPNAPRQGPFVEKELQFIADNYEKLTVPEMAIKLHRNRETVKMHLDNIIQEKLRKNEAVKLTVSHNFRDLPIFDELREQYTKRELQTIEFHWNKLISQFKSDVLHTEQMQILQYAETMVDIARVKKLERAGEETLDKLQRRIEELHNVDRDRRDDRWLARERSVDSQIADLRNSRKSVTEEKTKLTKQANDLLTSLNATRGQRVKIASDQQMDITSLLKALANDDFREQAIRQNHLMQRAAEQEKKKLSEEHRYMDGIYDRPILNSETVLYQEDLPIEGDYI